MTNVLDNCCYFIPDKALFGGHPSTEQARLLEDEGVKLFVDLTCPCESLTPYMCRVLRITYPIRDRSVPQDLVRFSQLVLKLSEYIQKLKEGEKIYIHCKGGHGRSGILVACILCYMQNIPPEEALYQTNQCHLTRKNMRDIWRDMGSPQTRQQKRFVIYMFKPFFFYRAVKFGRAMGLSNFSLHPVTIDSLGTFPTSENAFQAYKKPNDLEYVEKQKCLKPSYSKLLGNRVALRSDWEEVKNQIMYSILVCKFDQNPDIRENLISTGLRPLVEHTKYDSYWGDGGDGSGNNVLGQLLMKLRNSYHLNSDMYRELI